MIHLPDCFVNKPSPATRPPVSGLADPLEHLSNVFSEFSSYFSVTHVNCQSLSRHYEEILNISTQIDFHVLMLSETWLKPTLASKSVQLAKYTLYRHDRCGSKTGGGVAMYVRDDLKAKILFTSPDNSGIEFLFVEILVGSKKCVLGVVYWPPHIGKLSELHECLAFLASSYEHIIIMGDFNINLLNTNNANIVNYLTTLKSLNLNFLELGPTHHSNTSDTWIDHIIVSNTNNVVSHGQISTPGISKHDFLYLFHSFKCHKYEPKQLNFRDFRNISTSELLNDAFTAPWPSVYHQYDINSKIAALNQIITDIFDKHAPMKKVKAKRPPTPWFTKEIKLLMKSRDRAYSVFKISKCSSHKTEYKRLRNKVNQLIRNAKLRYYYNLFNSQTNMKLIWKDLKNIGVGKTKVVSTIDIPTDELNNHFVNMGTEINPSIKSDTLNSLEVDILESNEDKLYFKNVESSEVVRLIKTLKSNSTGSDGINAKQLKLILNAAVTCLTHILNFSLTTGSFPDSWKLALIHPIAKSDHPVNVNDYRPISILPTLSKILEKIVVKQIQDFLSKNNSLNPYQSGFRPHLSTQTALLKITEDIRKSLDNGEVAILTLLDFSKAFDSVDHDILLYKCKMLGFSNPVLHWLESYLKNRQQIVYQNGICSSPKTIFRGVPQGSVVGPLLFLIYVNELPSSLKYCSHHMYADDFQMLITGRITDLNNLIDKMNLDLHSIQNWSYRNGLVINPSKSQSILISSVLSQKRIREMACPSVQLNNIPIPWSTNVKNLGLIINNKLTWDDHINSISRKIFFTFHSLNRIKKFLPQKTRKLLVETLIYPHLDYCDSVYNDLNVKLANKLQIMQNTCVRYIFDLRKYDRITNVYCSNKILKLNYRRQIHSLVTLFQIVKRNGVPYLSRNFNFLSSRRLRELFILDLPSHKKSFLKNSFSVKTARVWNSLPSEIRCTSSLLLFKNKLKQWFLKQQNDTK